MKQEETRAKLIEGTIHVIAREGLDKATTKQIGLETSTNEAYIYRCFSDKEDLFSKTFNFLDEELLAKVNEQVEKIYAQEMNRELQCRLFFLEIWRFLLGNRDKCLTYVRYYYSPYFPQYSLESHKKRFAPTINKFKTAFKDEADVWMILNHILNVLLDFAVKVHTNQMSDEDDYAEHVFRVIYVSVKQYFRNNRESEFLYEKSAKHN